MDNILTIGNGRKVLAMGLTLRLDYIAMLASFVLLAGVLIGAF